MKPVYQIKKKYSGCFYCVLKRAVEKRNALSNVGQSTASLFSQPLRYAYFKPMSHKNNVLKYELKG
jgi:hypothetical protein